MFEVKAEGSSYSSTSTRSVKEVEKGCYVLEHVSTGKVIVGVSEHVTVEVNRNLDSLYGETHNNKHLNEVCKRDPELRVHVYPTKTVRQAEKLAKEIKDSVEPKYLFLGDKPERKKPCPAKVKSKPAPCAEQPTTKSSRTESTSPKMLPENTSKPTVKSGTKKKASK
jgi:hypothetical protein